MDLKKELKIVLPAMLCCLLWGSAFPAVKIGYRLFGIGADDAFSQIFFAGIRFFIAGIFTVLIGSAGAKKLLMPTRTSVPKILVLALFQTILQYLFFYLGLAHTTGIKGSILTASNVFISIVISALIFHQERLNAKKLIGCAIGFAGVIVINLTGTGIDMSFSLTGEGFIILSATAYSFSSAFMKMFSKTENPVMLSGWQFVVGGAFMAAVGFSGGGRIHPVSASAAPVLGHLAMISCVAFSIWGMLLKRNPVSRIAVYGFMNPVFGVILSSVLLTESGSFSAARVIVSLLLVTAGIIVVNYEFKSSGKPNIKTADGT